MASTVTQTVTIELSAEIDQLLQIASEEKGITVDEVIRQAILTCYGGLEFLVRAPNKG
jgi:hypothetical protein